MAHLPADNMVAWRIDQKYARLWTTLTKYVCSRTIMAPSKENTPP